MKIKKTKQLPGLNFLFSSFLILNISTGCALETDIDSYLKKVEANGKLNGNVLVIKNDTVLYENSFGYKDGTKTKKLNKHYRFNIGSIYKEFPAVAIHLFDKYQLNEMEISSQYPYPDTLLMAIPFNEDFVEDDYKISVKGLLYSATTQDMYQWFHNLDTFNILPRESLKFLSEEAVSGNNIRPHWEDVTG